MNPGAEQITPSRIEPQEDISSYENRSKTISVVLFIIAVLLLCSLITVFIVKSTKTYKLDAPVLADVPKITNKNSLTIEGQAPKNSTIEISTENKSFSTSSNKEGKFSVTTENAVEGRVEFHAIARKKILFLNFESLPSNTVSTTFDKTAPNIKLATIPKTVTTNSYTIKGTTSEPSKITISLNNKEYIVSTDNKNNFSFKLSLKEGINSVAVTAADDAGNQTSSAILKTSYSKGTVYASSNNVSSKLPNSSGDLPKALSSTYSRIVGFTALVLAATLFAASNGVITLIRIAKRDL